MTEAYLEGYKLDLSQDFSTKINFAIDDIKDFAERSTSWSNQVILPGTSTNNKLLGNIFSVNHSNAYNPALPNVGYNFNAAKAASIVVFQDNIQAFKGVMRLLEIVSDKGRIEYEVALFGDLTLLNAKLATGYLSDLDFSAYNHTYNLTNIVNSWDNAGGSGYYYPLIDFGAYGSGGTGKKDWDIRTFRPALYAKEYIDKMFSDAGFRYQCDLFNTSRFKKLIIPHGQKTIKQYSNPSVNAGRTTDYTFSLPIDSTAVSFESFSGNGFALENGTDVKYTAATANFNGTIKIDGDLINATLANQTYYIEVKKNGNIIIENDFVTGPGRGYIDETYTINNLSLGEDDTLTLCVRGDGTSGQSIEVFNASIVLSSAQQVLTDIRPNDNLLMGGVIPQNIKQVDFLKSIVQLFNLYVYEDKFDDRLIYIKPYVDFIDRNPDSAKDWTYKLNRDLPIRVKPLSELNAKLYEFKFKSDSDFYNDQYKKRYNLGYGDLIYDTQFEFTGQRKSLELIFSGTPIVGYQGEDKVFSTILKRSGNTEDQTDSNIRILQSKKVTGVISWSIKDGDSVLGSYTVYPYAGHYDDPDAPTNDLNFGVCKELFFTLTGGNVSTTQFNVYWSPYMAEITDKDSKLLSGKFYLTSKDIAELDFSKPIYLDGVLYRLNKITEYNASQPDECSVELFKINHLNYTGASSGGSDSQPDAFDFTDVSNAEINTQYTSNSITVTGIDTQAPISITNGQYSINGGTYTSSNGTVSNGDTVTVRTTSPSNYQTAKSVTLTIGGVSGVYSVTTKEAAGTFDVNYWLEPDGAYLRVVMAIGTPQETNSVNLTITGVVSYYAQGRVDESFTLTMPAGSGVPIAYYCQSQFVSGEPYYLSVNQGGYEPEEGTPTVGDFSGIQYSGIHWIEGEPPFEVEV